jgi:hypothetical protein
MTQKQLTDAMTTSTTIGRATGVVMQRFQLSADRAFELLTRVSRIPDVTFRHARRSSSRRDHQPVHPLNRCRASRIVVPAESSRLRPQVGPSTSHDREPYSPMLGQPRSSGRRGGVRRAPRTLDPRVDEPTAASGPRCLARAGRIEDHKSLTGCPSGRGGACSPSARTAWQVRRHLAERSAWAETARGCHPLAPRPRRSSSTYGTRGPSGTPQDRSSDRGHEGTEKFATIRAVGVRVVCLVSGTSSDNTIDFSHAALVSLLFLLLRLTREASEDRRPPSRSRDRARCRGNGQDGTLTAGPPFVH